MVSEGRVLWRGPLRVLVLADGALWRVPYVTCRKHRPRLLNRVQLRHYPTGAVAWFAPKPDRV